MRKYLIDELYVEDYNKLKGYLEKNFKHKSFQGIYWIPIHKDFLTLIQQEHIHCHPFYFAIDLENNCISCELLVRTQKKLKCECIGYASSKQRNWMIQYIDSIFDQLGIIFY